MLAPIRVLLVDDSRTTLVVLQRMLAAAPDIVVVGTAANGAEALEQVRRLDPAVVCTDLSMPVMDGVALTRAIMEHYPRPILVVSSNIPDGAPPAEGEAAFEVLSAGAVDLFPKPGALPEASRERTAHELARKIRLVAGVKVVTRRRLEPAGVGERPTAPPRQTSGSVPTGIRVPRSPQPGSGPPRILAIGASTGGPQAFQTLLTALPPDFPAPILCVQHISEGFLGGMVAWLNNQCALRVQTAVPGELPRPGTAYFPVENSHLRVDRAGRLLAERGDPVDGHRPSATALFRSIAEAYGPLAVGVLLTGMGADGAEGLARMRASGALTIAQDESTCTVFGMPREAILRGAAARVLPLPRIAEHLTVLFGSPGA
jgi:two-component system chemotaxis response regulator CheB